MKATRRIAFKGTEFILAIHAAAQQRGMTIADVARATHTNDSTLSLMKRKGRVPDVCTAQALASWAGLDLGDYVVIRTP